MIPIKTREQIEKMREGGKILAELMGKVVACVEPGISTLELDKIADELIAARKAKASFKMVKGYQWGTCINVNDGVVHGIPSDRVIIKDGDVVTVDIGVYWKGLNTDMARTVLVKNSELKIKNYEEKEKFLRAGEKAMVRAIKAARAGRRIGDISLAIDETISRAGYSPIEALTGHGVGIKLHESPQIPCVAPQSVSGTPLLIPGMALAIEVIYAQNSREITLSDDGWTIHTQDGGLAAVFEDTVLIGQGGAEILTSIG